MFHADQFAKLVSDLVFRGATPFKYHERVFKADSETRLFDPTVFRFRIFGLEILDFTRYHLEVLLDCGQTLRITLLCTCLELGHSQLETTFSGA